MIKPAPEVNEIIYSGVPFSEASGVLILVHGRGADAQGMLKLSDELNLKYFVFAAPQAENNTWYPYSFLEPVNRNEPFLSASLLKIKQLTDSFLSWGFDPGQLFYLGFSQGACLTLEFAARNPAPYGGIFALSGGLIGKENNDFKYNGSFDKAQVFLGCSDIDPHVPVERVNLSQRVFNEMGADVTRRIYPGMGHTINLDEMNFIKNSMKLIS